MAPLQAPTYVLYELAVRLRVAGILVRGEEAWRAIEDILDARRGGCDGLVSQRARERLRRMCGHAADRQSAQVRLDGGGGQTNGLLDRCERYGQQASLHRVAKHQDVGRDAVARQFHGELARRQSKQGAALEGMGDGRA